MIGVYIIMSKTGTPFSVFAERLTGDPYNHVSIGFDLKLKHVYSFSMTAEDNGFEQEPIEEFEGAELLIYRLEVTKEQRIALKERIKHYMNAPNEYNFKGLVNAFARHDIFEESPNMICSQFVANLLRDVDIDLFEGRPASTIRPIDYASNKKLVFYSTARVSSGRVHMISKKPPSAYL